MGKAYPDERTENIETSSIKANYAQKAKENTKEDASDKTTDTVDFNTKGIHVV